MKIKQLEKEIEKAKEDQKLVDKFVKCLKKKLATYCECEEWCQDCKWLKKEFFNDIDKLKKDIKMLNRCTDRNKDYVTFCTSYNTDDCKYTCGYARGMDELKRQRDGLETKIEGFHKR